MPVFGALEQRRAILPDRLRRPLDESVGVDHVALGTPQLGDALRIVVHPGGVEDRSHRADGPIVAGQALVRLRAGWRPSARAAAPGS